MFHSSQHYALKKSQGITFWVHPKIPGGLQRNQQTLLGPKNFQTFHKLHSILASYLLSTELWYLR
jgi:hypothetical protein